MRETGDRRQETRDRRQGTGDRGQEIGDMGMEEMKGYRRLDVWKKADESQMRRAAVSAPANIAEGYAHYSNKEKKRFYEIANCSLTELEYYIDFVFERLNYVTATQHKDLVELRNAAGRMLHGLIKSTRNKE